MERNDATRSGGNFVVPLILFTLVVATGGLLFIAALVVWLASVLGSLIGAMLLSGGLCILTALLIYLLGLQAPFALIRDRLDTVYEVAHTARMGYDWLLRRWQLLAALLAPPTDREN